MRIFSKKFINFFGPHFGLDLSDLSVKMVQIEKDKIDKIISYSSVKISNNSISNGEIIQIDKVVWAIKEATERTKPLKLKSKRVVCSLPEIKAFLRIVNIPKMSDQEAEEAVKWEMESNIPISINQVYYDWQFLEHNFSQEKNKKSVLVVAVAKKIIDQFIQVLEMAGLEVQGFEIESLAQVRSLIDQKSKNETSLVIDFGDTRTSFLFAFDTIPCFTSSLHLSASTLTDAIANKLGMTFEEAEKTKLTYGIGSSTKADIIFQAVQPVLENLIIEIEKSINFYLTGLKYSSNLDKIILCGGGANTKGIIPYLSKRIKRKIELANPWINLNFGQNLPIIEYKKSIQYSTAIGLAMKKLKDK